MSLAYPCLDLMVGLGISRKNVFVVDSSGVIYSGRHGGMDAPKERYAQDTSARTPADVVKGADVFLGCSTARVLMPELANAARPDCIIATGRSDYPNQVNNVLCFPYIFRSALDCGATRITESMKLACVREIAQLAKADIVRGHGARGRMRR